MQIRLTDKMQKAIAQNVFDVRTKRGILDVYKAAETIRLENIADNVAREDIVEKLVHLAGLAFVPVEFNKHTFESEGAYYRSTDFLGEASNTDVLNESQSVH